MLQGPDIGQPGVDLSIPVFNLDALKKTEKATRAAAVTGPSFDTMTQLELLNLRQELTDHPHRCSDNSF